jgi:hypothetical protein
MVVQVGGSQEVEHINIRSEQSQQAASRSVGMWQ